MTTAPVILGNVVLSNGNLAVLAGNPYTDTAGYSGFDQLQVAILSDSTPIALNQTSGNLSFPSGDSPDGSVPGDVPGILGNPTAGGGTIAALPGGGMAVMTWGDSNLNYDLQILNNAGTVTTQPFVVHSQFTTAGNNQSNAANPQGAVAAWSGGLVVAYSTDDESKDYYQRYTLAGVAVGSAVEFASTSDGSGTGWVGSMAVDSSGNVIFGFGTEDIYTPGAYKMYSGANAVLNTPDSVGKDATTGATEVANQGGPAPTFVPLSGGGFATVGYTSVGTYDATDGWFPSFTLNIQTVSTGGAITTQDTVPHAVEDNYYQSAKINWISVLPNGTVEFQEERDNSYYHDANVANSYTVGGALNRGGVTLALPSDGSTPFYLPPATGPESNVVGLTVNASNQLVGEGVNTATVAAPSITGISPDTGTSSTDGITDTGALTVNGTATAGTSIALFNGATQIGTTTTGSGGTWSILLGTALGQGSYSLTATASSGGTTSSLSTGYAVTVDTTAPSVASDNLVGSSPNHASSEQFAVTFSESVVGVSTSSFQLTDTGSVAGSIASVTGSGSSYTVTVTGVTGNGTMRLDLKSSGAGIADAAGNVPAGYTSGQTYTIETPPPVISGAVAGQTTTDEATVTPFAGVSITDPNVSQTEAITITLSHGGASTDADGTLSGAGLTKTGTGAYTLSAGTPSAVSTELEGLVFTPTAHQVAPGGSVTTTFTIQVTDTAGGTSSNSSTTVAATAVNDPPVISGASAGHTTTDEATISPFAGVAISDADFGQTETVAITLSNHHQRHAVESRRRQLRQRHRRLHRHRHRCRRHRRRRRTGVHADGASGRAGRFGHHHLHHHGHRHRRWDQQQQQHHGRRHCGERSAGDRRGHSGSDHHRRGDDLAVHRRVDQRRRFRPDRDGDDHPVEPPQRHAVEFGGGSYDSATGVYSVTGTDAAVTAAVDGLVFTPAAHQVAPGGSVTTTFTITATDTAGGTSSNSSTTVGATAVNDPPVIAGATAGQTTTDEATISPFTGVSISDVDFGQTETVTITLSNHLNGTLSSSAGGSYDSATGVYSVTGTDTAVTTAVDGVVFTPTAHQVAPGGSVTTTFTITATDTAGGTSSNSSTTVGAIAVNDPPVIAGATAGQTTTDEVTISPFTGVSISDVDFGQTETVAITLSNHLNGTLSSSAGGSYDSATGVYSVTGTDAAVTAAVDGLVFTPAAHQVAPGGSVTTTFTITATDTAGGTSSNSSTTVGATAVNDPPVIAGATAGQTTTDEATISPFTGVSISDVDAGATETVAIMLSNLLNGTLSSSAGGSYDSATGVYTVTGTDAAVTAAVDGLVFTPAAHQVAPGGSVTTTFTITATDTAGGTSSNSSTTVGATAVNDPPVIAGATAGQTTTDEATISPFTGVSISDVDFGQTETVAITLSNHLNGTLSSSAGGSYDSATGVYSVTGTDAAVTAAVDGLVFTPTAHQVAPGGSVTTTFTITATDTAGASASDANTTLAATALSDPPVIAGATAGQTTTDEATISPFTGVSINDVDAGATETLTISLSGSGGTLSGAGLTGGSGSYTLSGTAAAVTTELDALSFTATAGAPGTSGTTTFTLSDASSIFATPTVNSATTVTDVDPTGTGWGDVHMVTFQGLHYDFQAVGDFTLAKGTTSADPFDVQIRTSPWASMISVTTEIAAQVGGNAVQFDLDGDVMLNGVVDTSLGSINAVQAIDGGTISRTSANSYVVDWASGESLDVTNAGPYFNETVTLSAKDGPGSVQGLLGSNSNQATDIQLANGTVLNAPTDSQLLGVYAESWSVADSASLLNDNTSLPLAMSNDGDAATPFNGQSFVDLAGLRAASATLGFREDASGAFGTLTIQSGSQQSSMTLLGQYAAAGFGIASDGHGGTIVDYTPPKVTMLG